MRYILMPATVRAGLLMLFLTTTFVVGGCNDSVGEAKVSKENASKIKKGMSRDEVVKILGPPSKPDEKDEDGVKVEIGGETKVDIDIDDDDAVWQDGDKKIIVDFDDDKVSEVETVGL